MAMWTEHNMTTFFIETGRIWLKYICEFNVWNMDFCERNGVSLAVVAWLCDILWHTYEEHKGKHRALLFAMHVCLQSHLKSQICLC